MFDDLGVDAAKTGMLFSRPLVETVADYLEEHTVPLVVDPVMVASSGATLLLDDAVDALSHPALPPRDRGDAEPAGGRGAHGRWTARVGASSRSGSLELGAPAALVTGGHGDPAVDHLFDGERHVEIPIERVDVAATHGAGCTHSATLAAELAKGATLEEAARTAAGVASAAVANGLVELGRGEGPVDVLHLTRGAA